jgi:RHS repeat-associated protein
MWVQEDMRTTHLAVDKRYMTGSISRAVLLWRLAVVSLLLAILVGAMVVAGSVVVSSSSATGKRKLSPQRQSGFAQSERRIVAQVARRRRWLESPRLKAQRVSSRIAFHELATGPAQRLLASDFGSVLAGISANPSASIERDGRVVRYLSEYRALVRTSHGLQVETSTVPLRATSDSGEKRPVDLRLKASAGGFVPANPLVAVSIARNSDGGVVVGHDGLRVALLGTNVAGSVINGQDAFFSNVGPDTDALVAPKLAGAELSVLLRSRLSPEQLRYRVTLPAGAILRPAAGGAVVSRAGVTLARIPAPSARDAQGTYVPVQMRVTGNELVLSVAHRKRDLAYPVLVDPEVVESITKGADGWEFYDSTYSIPTTWCEGKSGQTSSTGECLGDSMFSHSGSSGGPLTISMPSIALPYEVTTTNPETGEPLENEVKGGAAEWWWLPVENYDATAIEFEGIASSGSSEAEQKVIWSVGACNKYREWSSTEGAPSSVIFVPTKGHSCTKGTFPREEATLYMDAYSTKSLSEIEFKEPTIVKGSISVGAVLVTRPMSLVEEEGYEAEEYGETNEGQPHRPKCLAGKPVNCATGDEVETQTDLSVGGRGLGLNVTRTYNSRMASKQAAHGPFGFGWTGSYGAHLVETAEGIDTFVTFATVYQSNGSAVVFEHNGPESKYYPVNPLTQGTLVYESGTYIYTLPNQTKQDFNSKGRLLSETGRDGNTTTMKYNSEGQLESVSDPSGRKLTFAYNTEGEVTSVKDPMGHTVKYTYEAGNLKSVTQPGESSLRWQFKYGSSHEMTSETDGRGNTTTIEYTTGGRVTSETDPLKRVRKWKYSATSSGTETVITEPNGSETVEEFNNAGAVTSITHAAGTSIAATTTYEYNESGELTGVTDPSKHKTEYSYDSAGDRTSEKDADGDETKWMYDSTHDIETMTTPDGETTTIKREAHGNPEVIERPAPGGTTQKTTYKYDAYGDVESMTNALEQTWKYEYDSYGDRKAEVDPEGDKRTWEYNEDSQEIAEVSPRGNSSGAKASEFTTKTERDAQGRSLKITDPLGHTTKYTYDGDGNIATVIDGNSHTTKYTNDADNELTKTEEPNKTVTETEYDSMGQVKSQIDGNKHVTKYVRNALEEVEEVVNPLGKKTLKEYSAAGNLVKLTDSAKRTTTFTYDPANRLTEISYSSGKPGTIKYEYNKDGDRTKMTDGTGTTTYTYDQLDRMTESENGHKEVVKYEYNLGNQQTKITYPNTKAIERTYDKDGRLEKVTDWSSSVTKFTYNPDSELATIAFPSATKDEDTYAYNDADQMSEIKMDKSTEVLASLVYTRDNDGQVKKTTAKGLPGAEITENTYDENNRLTKYGSNEYKYDADNNATTEGSSTNTYNEGDELEKGTSVTYSYDELGERTKTTPGKGPATTYGYDQVSNLTSVERPKEGETTEIKDTYAYNGEGLRTSQTISGTTSYMAWGVTEGLPSLLGDGTNSYIYGPGDLPIEQINTSTGTVQYLHHDQQGSTRLLTGSTGTVTGKCTYGAYGTPTCEGTGTPLGYDGQYTSSDTGLIYLRARVYDPTTAQFLTRDPAVMVTREPYVYAEDNPSDYGDRSGLGWEESFAGGSGIPCTWCAADEGTTEALEGASHAVEHGIEGAWNAIHENEESGDEGAAELQAKEAERESECGTIPTGSKPPKAAYRDLEQETGLSRGKLSDALHKLKKASSIPNDANTRVDSDGNVYDEETGENIGNIIDEAHG